MKNYVAYFRVSTMKQGISGLGLESQKSAVISFVGANNLLNEFVEIESGKNNNRIELNKAIDYAKQNNAILVIAKLDRLSRNATFILTLRDSGIEFVCCDMPDANKFTIGIFALLAQQERELISERTKKALQSKKDRGFKLGSPDNLTNVSRLKSIEVRKEIANSNPNNRKAFALIKSLRSQGVSFNKIAQQLNESGFKTATNKDFFAMSVKQLFERFNNA